MLTATSHEPRARRPEIPVLFQILDLGSLRSSSGLAARSSAHHLQQLQNRVPVSGGADRLEPGIEVSVGQFRTPHSVWNVQIDFAARNVKGVRGGALRIERLDRIGAWARRRESRRAASVAANLPSETGCCARPQRVPPDCAGRREPENPKRSSIFFARRAGRAFATFGGCGEHNVAALDIGAHIAALGVA